MDEWLTYAAGEIAQLEDSLRRLDAAAREAPVLAAEAPVFVAGLGWRSGSTLAQRALMTDPAILVWGEPMDRLLLLDRLTEPLMGINQEWPTASHWISHRGEVDLARDWVATLAPDAGRLKGAYRAFFDTWLAQPARERGFARWGAKEVRWSGLHAVMLRWLYPDCRLLLVVRHPVSAYLSLRNAGFEPPEWGEVVRWPDRWILTLDEYARFWNRMALSWAAVLEPLGVTWFRYEDLVEDRVDLDAIAAGFGLSTNTAIARAARAGEGLRSVGLTPKERDRVNALTVEGRALFAYLE